MSYDFDASVVKIRDYQSHSDWTAVLHELGELWSHNDCPLTPALWLLYAHSAAAASSQHSLDLNAADLLELGVLEFPGSAALQWARCCCCWENATNNDTCTDQALQWIARGSHRNEDVWVAAVYDKSTNNKNQSKYWLQRAYCPMKSANDDLMSLDVTQQLFKQGLLTASQADHVRLQCSKQFGSLAVYEDAIDAALEQEGLLEARLVAAEQLLVANRAAEWVTWVCQQQTVYGMGLGGRNTAHAYIQYALAVQALAKVENHDDDNDEDVLDWDTIRPQLTRSVYERGIAECPTVEGLWLSYIRHVTEHLDDRNASELTSITHRAVRNCPYSVALWKQRMQALLFLANHKLAVLDPDNVMEMVQQALDTKFLPGPINFWSLYHYALGVVKRRILFLLNDSSDVPYDDPEEIQTKKVKNANGSRTAVSVELSQEVQDLAEDLKDMYDEIEARLKKAFGSWSEGRRLLYNDRAATEAMLLQPLDQADSDLSPASSEEDKALKWAGKAVRTHSPPHPDTYRSYIQLFTTNNRPTTIAAVASHIRHVRFLFHKAVSAVGQPKPKADAPPGQQRDFGAALSSLCHEWIEFEKLLGSERSQGKAMTVIEKKLRTSAPYASAPDGAVSATSPQAVEQQSKRKTSIGEELEDEPPRKKPKVDDTAVDMHAGHLAYELSNVETESPPAVPKPNMPKVRVGKLEYPAHPYTVRVSNLSDKTEDMEVVDLFRSKCGPVVHARILRQRDPHLSSRGKSKGWALVQFEERESVDQALALNDVVGLHENVLKIDRSHMPAALIVPPGMHRVSEKGQGKYSKRNQRRKDGIDDGASQDSKHSGSMAEASVQDVTKRTGTANVLAFVPRGVSRKQQQKPKISLGDIPTP